MSRTEDAIAKMVDEHITAILKGDTAWINNNFNDKYLYVSPLGVLINKADIIRQLVAGVIKIDSIRQSDKMAFVYGSCGIVIVLITTKEHAWHA